MIEFTDRTRRKRRYLGTIIGQVCSFYPIFRVRFRQHFLKTSFFQGSLDVLDLEARPVPTLNDEYPRQFGEALCGVSLRFPPSVVGHEHLEATCHSNQETRLVPTGSCFAQLPNTAVVCPVSFGLFLKRPAKFTQVIGGVCSFVHILSARNKDVAGFS